MLGAAGLGIGLALQGTLQKIAAGLMLLLLRPFRVGDYIEGAGTTTGTVNEISLFHHSSDEERRHRHVCAEQSPSGRTR